MSDNTDVERYFTGLLLHVCEVSFPFRENRVVTPPPPSGTSFRYQTIHMCSSSCVGYRRRQCEA